VISCAPSTPQGTVWQHGDSSQPQNAIQEWA
jgi:hypothetical protein